MISAGKQLGRYKINSSLGAGGMGEVFLAEDTDLERRVALKVLPHDLSQNEERMRRFIQEAKTASALNHPNILTVYEIGQVEGTRFIATELVNGETLREKSKGEDLSLPEKLEIAVQIAAALNAAHEAGIVHRDIKPENVMIRPDGIVKVLDFGLAKLAEPSGEFTADAEAVTKAQVQTQAGMIIGTAAYMSPEQARGRRVDARSDIFSFGVCLYEMLAGFNPFQSETAVDALAAVLQREPEPLSVLKSDVPEELSRIVARTLRKNADERYQSSAELLGDLKQFQQQLSLGAILKSSQTSALRSGETINSLAILPLRADGDDAQTEYLSDGITESIINALAQISDLSVAPRSTVFRFKGTEKDAPTIGRQLGVRTILTGRVRQYGENLIIGVELIDVERGAQIWGEQYRRQLADIFELQEEIAEDISEKLKLKLTGEEKRRLTKRYTENAEAYQCYLKGRYFVTTKRTEEWIKKGIEYFQQAIELDPTYALAYAGIADAYAFLASSTGGWSPHDAYPKAKAAAERALAIDETLGEPHSSLGFFRVLYDWNFPAAEREFKRAIELAPNYPTAHDGYGFYLKAMGRHQEAIRECQTVSRLDPLSPFAHVSLGWAYYFAREYDNAIKECKNALEMEQDSTFAYRILGFAYLQQGKFEDALSALRKAVIFSDGGLAFEAHLGYAYAVTGKETEARQVLKDLESDGDGGRYVSSYYFAVIYLGLGETDEAFEWLEKACEERSGFMPFLNVEPMFDSIRTDSRFADLLRRIGLPADETAQVKTLDEASEARTVLLSPVTTDPQETPATVTGADEQTPPEEPKKKRNWLRNWFWILLLSFVVLAGFFAYRRPAALTDSKQIESIAVMPFENASGNTEIEYLSDGMTETLINSLSQLPNLNVKARSSVFRYKGKEIDPKKIASELNVQAILTGRVVQRGEQLTLSLELIDAQTENVIWGNKYERRSSELVALQSEVARDVSSKLKSKLSGADVQKLAKTYTTDSEAYRLYLQGRFFWNKRAGREFKKAEGFFRQSVEKDPNFALGYVGLADIDEDTDRPKKKEYILRALALDDQLAEAHASFGYQFMLDYDWAAAEREFKRAMELNPNNPQAHQWNGARLMMLGRYDESLASIKRALEIDPTSAGINFYYGVLLFVSGKTDESIRQFKKLAEMEPTLPWAHTWLSNIYRQQKNYAASVEERAKSLEINDKADDARLVRESFAKDGWNGYLREMIRQSTVSPTSSRALPATSLAQLGEKEKSITELIKGANEGDFWLFTIKYDPAFDSLRDDPRFRELLKKFEPPQ